MAFVAAAAAEPEQTLRSCTRSCSQTQRFSPQTPGRVGGVHSRRRTVNLALPGPSVTLRLTLLALQIRLSRSGTAAVALGGDGAARTCRSRGQGQTDAMGRPQATAAVQRRSQPLTGAAVLPPGKNQAGGGGETAEPSVY